METSLNNGFALSSFFYTYRPAQKMSKKKAPLCLQNKEGASCLLKVQFFDSVNHVNPAIF